MRITFIGREKDGKAQIKLFDVRLRPGMRYTLDGLEIFSPMYHISVMVEDDQFEVPEDEMRTLKDKIRKEVEYEIAIEMMEALVTVVPYPALEKAMDKFRERDEE